MRRSGICRQFLASLAAAAIVAMAGNARAATPSELLIPGDHVFPESITGTQDGTLIIGSLGDGMIFRAPPGATTAQPWIGKGVNGIMSVLGVLADEKSGTLWACSSDFSPLGVVGPAGSKPVALKAFDLKTGAPKGSYPLPGEHTLCNDIVVGPDGTAYVTDSFSPHILRLKPGARQLEVWATDPRFKVPTGAGLDGIAIGSDGNIYVNTFNGGGLFRVIMRRDGSAGAVTQLQPSRPLELPDGLRAFGPGKFLMIEGAGRLDLVTVQGDKANIQVLKKGYKGPVSLVQQGHIAWVLEGQLNWLFNPKLGKPGPFRASALPLPAE